MATKRFSKPAYVCGGLTEVPEEERAALKAFYEEVEHVFKRVTGVPAWVPHKHFDPVIHAHFTPAEVWANECEIVCNQTGFIVVCGYFPSWGGGIEVAWATQHDVPGILLCDKQRLEDRLVSRLLRGAPIFADTPVIASNGYADALAKLEAWLRDEYQLAVDAEAEMDPALPA